MFTPEQKEQLLINLDIEGTPHNLSLHSVVHLTLPSVAHRTRQLEAWLSDTLAAFRDRHERQLTYIPHLVRGMTMAEFGDKYDGDVQAALRGLKKEGLAVDVAPLDRNQMKRKWAPVPEEEEHGKNANNGHDRAAKHREWPYLYPLTSIFDDFYYTKFALHLHHPRRNHHPSQEITLLPASKLQRHQALYVALYLYIVTVPAQPAPRQKVPPHRPIPEPEQTRPHTLSASLPCGRLIAHQTHGVLPRPPSQQLPRTLDFDIQACDPTAAKDTHVSPTTTLAAEGREHAQH